MSDHEWAPMELGVEGVPVLDENGDVCEWDHSWTYGGLTPVIEADCLVAIDVLDEQGRVRLRVPIGDVKNAVCGGCYFVDKAWEATVSRIATTTSTTGEAVSYERDARFPECH